MEYKDIVVHLCYYNPLNPERDNFEDEDRKWKLSQKGRCYCDNCFSGKDELATELLKYIKERQSQTVLLITFGVIMTAIILTLSACGVELN